MFSICVQRNLYLILIVYSNLNLRKWHICFFILIISPSYDLNAVSVNGKDINNLHQKNPQKPVFKTVGRIFKNV